MTTDVYRAVVGDFYRLWVNDHGQEFFRGRDAAPGLSEARTSWRSRSRRSRPAASHREAA